MTNLAMILDVSHHDRFCYGRKMNRPAWHTHLRKPISIRRLIACGFAVVLAISGAAQAEAAANLAPADHSEFCDCGIKCRRDRCCCRPSEPDPVVPAATDEGADGNSVKASTICSMTSRCQDPVEVVLKWNLRTRLEWASADFVRTFPDTGSYLVRIPAELLTFSRYFDRLERPPRG